MSHPRRANRKPHDHARKLVAHRRKHARAKRRMARGLANVIESLH